ncbi:hypothetical protein COCSUDRAFT_58690 [Coccomyxa subellipsoidea C-169]|uniref:Band 7 domain-containing protein n=1 Tax=Coccomyxa subellipsoidea (strain C-169) TaxID=574566 RepID=I0YLY3_COCSC|nr:hypothetical protein COCSUDRAFT_58690 [Coccomyxa subellipsoidea C-169]EIE19402.1 hypothetical protein COCSUDRAFT_58690 [Coccomyxa subellipsoidea C-169]|eukprot:XP_005643946.1 hypothetical protein COCSUDRAFT_58690 [Coccomyxa subellipsoidea C-169]
MAGGGAFAAGFGGSCVLTSVAFIVLFLIIGFAKSFHRLDSTEMAVTWSPFTRQLLGVKEAGLYFRLIVEMLATFQYQIVKKDLMQLTKQYRDFDKYHQVMHAAADRAIHYACAQFNVGQFQSQRIDVQAATRQKMQLLVHDLLRADIMDVQLKNVQPPDAWKGAVASKQKAQQDILLAYNERDQALAKANRDLQLAQQTATILMQEAQTNATVIMQRAVNEAAAIRRTYQEQAEIAANITKTNGLSIDGYIAYLQNRLFEQQSSLDIAMDAPQADLVSSTAG